MSTIVVMCGLPSSGKSSVAKDIAGVYNATILESDEYRRRLYGAAEIQGDNNKLFEQIQSDAVTLLKSGKNVVYDSTNISYKNRIAFNQRLKKIEGVIIECIVVATDIGTCKRRNAERSRKVPEHVIDRMWKSFTMPQYSEGFDEINILFSYNLMDYLLKPYVDEIKSFHQDNPHHSMTLGEHTEKVVQGVSLDSPLMRHVALLHDNGKRYTKVFKNAKGETSDIAHFYGHENCGAYEAMFFLDVAGFKDDDIIYGCGLIQNHMRMYNLDSEKAKNKLINQIGEKMYADLIILHEADRNSK